MAQRSSASLRSRSIICMSSISVERFSKNMDMKQSVTSHAFQIQHRATWFNYSSMFLEKMGDALLGARLTRAMNACIQRNIVKMRALQLAPMVIKVCSASLESTMKHHQ